MAQAGYTPIQLYYSTTGTAAPTAGNLANGELAINITDGKLYYKDNGGVVQTLAVSPTATGSANGVLYLNGSKVPTAGSALTFDGTNFATTGTVSGTKLIPTGGTATGNGMYLPAANTLGFTTNGAETMRIDSSGNLGLGVTPSAWRSSDKAIQVNTYAAISSNTAGDTQLMNNSYFNSGGAGIYINTNYASRYQQYQGSHSWFTAPSGTAGNAITFTQAMTLDASGNLGLGITPSAWSANTRAIQTGSRGSLSEEFVNNGRIAYSSNAYATSSTAWAYIVNGLASSYQQLNGVHSWYTAPSSTAGNTITFTQAMTLDESGNLLLGRTSAPSSETFSVNGVSSNFTTSSSSYSTTGWYGVNIRGDVGAINISRNGSNVMAFFHESNGDGLSGSPVGTISITTTATTYSTSSDYRLKHNIQPMTGALTKVQQLKPVTYKWNTNDSDGQGFIAHELQAVIPDAVTGEKDAVDEEGKPVYQGVDTSFLVATLTAAIQELNAKVEAQAAEIAALKGQ